MSYWENEGKYQEEYSRIWNKYVPTSGECSNQDAEMVRLISRVYHDFYNNGFCNWSIYKGFSQKLYRIAPDHISRKVRKLLNIVPDQNDDWFYVEDVVSTEEYEAIKRLLEEILDDTVSRSYQILFERDDMNEPTQYVYDWILESRTIVDSMSPSVLKSFVETEVLVDVRVGLQADVNTYFLDLVDWKRLSNNFHTE